MGKEYTRTLNNASYNGDNASYNGKKKLSKKNSKKNSKSNSKSNSKKNVNKNNNTTEEMLEILNSDTDVTYQSKNNNLIPFNGDIPPQYMNMNQQMNMAQQPQMNNMAAYSPLNYDPMMLQPLVPVQMNQNEDMFTNLNNLNKGPFIGGMMNNNLASASPFQNNALNSAPMQQPNNIASTLGNNINLENLNMLGVSKL
jgi:hypothetical protein